MPPAERRYGTHADKMVRLELKQQQVVELKCLAHDNRVSASGGRATMSRGREGNAWKSSSSVLLNDHPSSKTWALIITNPRLATCAARARTRESKSHEYLREGSFKVMRRICPKCKASAPADMYRSAA